MTYALHGVIRCLVGVVLAYSASSGASVPDKRRQAARVRVNVEQQATASLAALVVSFAMTRVQLYCRVALTRVLHYAVIPGILVVHGGSVKSQMGVPSLCPSKFQNLPTPLIRTDCFVELNRSRGRDRGGVGCCCGGRSLSFRHFSADCLLSDSR